MPIRVDAVANCSKNFAIDQCSAQMMLCPVLASAVAYDAAVA
jgi:hypothetical protein